MLHDPYAAQTSPGKCASVFHTSHVHAQVRVAAPPNTSIDAARGVVTSGNLTLAFHLAPNEATQPAPDQATGDASSSPSQASRKSLLQQHAERATRACSLGRRKAAARAA